MLEYLVKLKDGISGPAAAASSAVKALRTSLAALRDTAKEAGTAASIVGLYMQTAMGRFVSKATEGVDAARVLKLSIAAVGAAALTASYALGKTVLGAAQFRESNTLRLAALLGDQKKGDQEFIAAIKIAERTQFDPKQAVAGLASLSEVFQQGDMRRAFFGAIADVVTITGGGNEEMAHMILAVKQSMQAGKAMGQDLNQMVNAGLGKTFIYKAIADQFGIKAKDQEDLNRQAQKLIESGGVTGDRWTKALFQALMARGGGSKAGETAEKMGSSTITGLISNIKGGMDTLLGMQDTTSWPAITALKSLLKDVADLFSTDSDKGKTLSATLKSLSSAVAPVFAAMQRDLGGFTALLSQGGPGAETFAGGLSVIATTLCEVISGVTWFTVGVVQLFGWLAKGGEAVGDFLFSLGSIGDYFKDLDERLYEIGRNCIDSMIRGVQGAWQEMKKVPADVAKGFADAWRGALGIHSPSRVFAEIGRYSMEGFVQGTEAVDVRGSVGQAAGQVVSGAAGARSPGGGAGGISVEVNLSLSSSGMSPQAVAQELLPQLGAAARDAVEQALRRWEQQGA